MKKTTQLMEELNGSDDINSFLSNNKDSLDRQDFARYMDIRYLQEQDFQARIR